MRFGRIILLAGLGPILTLSAMEAPRAPEHNQGKKSLVAFLRSVAILVAASEATPISSAMEKSSPQTVLSLGALAATPLRHSLWMIQSPASAALPSRQLLPAPLRC